MSTVCGSECIVYEYVTQGSQFFAELLTVFGLFCTVTGVLQKDYISVFHSLNSCFCVRSYNLRICCKFNFLSKKLGKDETATGARESSGFGSPFGFPR